MKELQEAKKNTKASQQGKLNMVFKALNSSIIKFTWEGVLHAVAQFVACNN